MQFPNSTHKGTCIVSFIVTLLQHICAGNFLERFLLQPYYGIWTCCMPNEWSDLLQLYCTFTVALLQLLLLATPHKGDTFVVTLLRFYCSFITAFVVWYPVVRQHLCCGFIMTFIAALLWQGCLASTTSKILRYCSFIEVLPQPLLQHRGNHQNPL